MKLDLTKDQRKIRRYIEQRIKEYAVYENNGPGDDEDPIRLVTMGYYLEQTGYFALVFDTRPDADSDGEWTLYIDEEEDEDLTTLHFPKWCSMIETWYEGMPIDLVLPTGKSRRITRKSHTHETIAQIFGEMLHDTMISLRDEGALAPLPLADDAFLVVEEFDGHWSSSKSYKTRKRIKLKGGESLEAQAVDSEESDDDRKVAFLKRIRKLPVERQITYWKSELDRRAAGKRSDLDAVFLDTKYAHRGNECALDELERIGERSVGPLLELARKWSRYPEWNGDRPKKKFRETPMQSIVLGAIWKVGDLGYRSERIEKQLQQIVRIACKANEKRKLWGAIPFHAARCLHTLFESYPKPAWDPNTNRLRSPEQFQSRPE